MKTVLLLVGMLNAFSPVRALSLDLDLCRDSSGFELAIGDCSAPDARNGYCGSVPKNGKNVLIIGVFWHDSGDKYVGTKFYNRTSTQLGRGLNPYMNKGCYSRENIEDEIEQYVGEARRNDVNVVRLR